MTVPVSTRDAVGRELAKVEIPLLGAGIAAIGAARYLSRFDLSTGPIICPLRRTTGIPCPFCGMTTSFAHLAGGRVWESFVASPLGPILFAATVAGVVALIWALLTRKRLSIDFSPRANRIIFWAGLSVMLLLMLYQNFRIGPLHPLLA